MPTTTTGGASNAWEEKPSESAPDAAETVPEPADAGDEVTDVNEDGELDVYERATGGALSAECERRGLPKSGTKADLVRRLQADDEAHGKAAAL